MATPVLLCDVNNQVIYANRQCYQLFNNHSNNIKSSQPQFDANNLLNSSSNVLFDNQPNYQTLLLAPEQQIEVELNYQNTTFSLIAGPVSNDTGEKIGIVYEFVDLSEQRLAEQQVDSIITAAVSGELDTRMDCDKFNGFMLTLGSGINQMLDAIVKPINQTQNYLTLIANGQVPKQIKGDYQGDFLVIKQSLEKSCQAINRLIIDTNDIVKSTSMGELSIRADEMHTMAIIKK